MLVNIVHINALKIQLNQRTLYIKGCIDLNVWLYNNQDNVKSSNVTIFHVLKWFDLKESNSYSICQGVFLFYV